MKQKTIIKKIFITGNSLAVRIPFRIVKKLKLESGDLVELKIKKEENGKT